VGGSDEILVGNEDPSTHEHILARVGDGDQPGPPAGVSGRLATNHVRRAYALENGIEQVERTPLGLYALEEDVSVDVVLSWDIDSWDIDSWDIDSWDIDPWVSDSWDINSWIVVFSWDIAISWDDIISWDVF
jgi:hypothetical protein